MECMEWMQLQKKKQDQTNFFEIHLTLLHVFMIIETRLCNGQTVIFCFPDIRGKRSEIDM